MGTIKSDIQEAITNSGAKQVGSGGISWLDAITSFSKDYREGTIYGRFAEKELV
jgi:hypothetical protein